ncbi:MAG: phospholipase D family protein [Flavobacteriales bacterium]|jgi:hypothetical protein|nr:phospholipase D family protein [Flavobacteriales bacterium]
MSKFITGKALETAIYDIIWDTKETLLIVSPFIKLDDYFKELFDKHENNPNIHLLIVFGKNENEVSRSMSEDDFDYFKKFLNVSIVYASNLHAKYYGNETKGIITSINLYDYSFKNNIEFGVYSEQGLLDRFKTSADVDAWNECKKIAETNEVVFIKRPVYQTKKFIVNLGKNYVKSDVIYDSTEQFYKNRRNRESSDKRLNDFPTTLELGSTVKARPKRIVEEEAPKKEVKKEYKRKNYHSNTGYCIRTGIEIPYNPYSPLSYDAWQVWVQFEDYDFPEQYCHRTGKRSYGKTSMRKPELSAW